MSLRNPPDLSLRAVGLVALGAAVGGLGRWALASDLTPAFPWGITIANVLGSYLLGVLMFGGVLGGWFGVEARQLVAIGLLGAFTTMSGFTVATLALVEAGRFPAAVAVILVNPVLSLGAAFAGRVTAYALPGGR